VQDASLGNFSHGSTLLDAISQQVNARLHSLRLNVILGECAGGGEVHAVRLSQSSIEWTCRCGAAMLSVDVVETDFGCLVAASSMDSAVTIISGDGHVMYRSELNARLLPKVRWCYDRQHLLVATGQATLVLMRVHSVDGEASGQSAAHCRARLELSVVHVIQMGSNVTDFAVLEAGTLIGQPWPAVLCARRSASKLTLCRIVDEESQLRLSQVMPSNPDVCMFRLITCT
jgi:hypothetical protein